MQGYKILDRRRFLLQCVAATAAFSGPMRARAEAQTIGGTTNVAGGGSPAFNPDVEIDLLCEPGAADVLQGRETNIWRYAATLLKGPERTLTTLPDSYLGPLMRFQHGQRIRINLRNRLPQATITHWHGLHVPMAADGHPEYAIEPGGTFVYEFEIRNRASMNFYHPHTHEATATQVYRGLAGAIIVNDDEERALELPSGEFEIPIVIQDRTFDDDNQLVYGGGMHQRMVGFQGERILVNGRPDFGLDVASSAYRLRVLNGSNSRIYKLAWDDGSPIIVLGVDGGLLEQPESRPYVILGPGERLDVWADFSGRAVGSRLAMISAEFAGVLPRMAERMMGNTDGFRVGSRYPIFSVRVTKAVGDSPSLPRSLSKMTRYRVEDTANPTAPTPIAISEAPMSMLLNGRAYGEDNPLPGERVAVDTLRLIDIFHDHAAGMGHGMMHGRGMGMGGMGMGGMGMMMSMAHPIHLHGQPFQIVARDFDDGGPETYASMREGFIDSGLKDTVLVTPGERLRIIKPFQDFEGRFMYHCHNLEHEDMGMMREFWVE